MGRCDDGKLCLMTFFHLYSTYTSTVFRIHPRLESDAGIARYSRNI